MLRKISVIIIIIFSLAFALSYYLNRPPELIDHINHDCMVSFSNEEMPEGPILADYYKEGFYTLLVAGTDKEGYLTDTIMVVALDTVNDKLNIVSVPRDTQVDVTRSPKKINTAYTIGGVEQLKKEIKSIVGFAPNYHIVLGLEAFEKLVDAVGGVEFNVPRDMDKDDAAQGLHIHLKKGWQILDGDKAMQLVRYRDYLNADIGRIETQHQFLLALANKLLAVSNIPGITEFVDIFKQHVQTDISVRDMQWFGRQVMELDAEKNITMQTLPYSGFGEYRGHNYLYLETEEVINIVNRSINPYTRDIVARDVRIIRLED